MTFIMSVQVTTKFMRDPIRILVKRDELTLEGIKQFYITIEKEEWKLETLVDLYATLTITQVRTFIHPPSHCTPFSLFLLFLYFSLCSYLSHSLPLSICLSLSVSTSLFLCVSLFFSFSVPTPPCPSLSLSHSLSFSLSFSILLITLSAFFHSLIVTSITGHHILQYEKEGRLVDGEYAIT